MNQEKLKKTIERFEIASFTVSKKIGAEIKEQIQHVITSDQHLILRYIHKFGPCISTELSEIFNVQKSAITAIINRLVEKGYIKRSRDDHDRRVIYLSTTEEGEKIYQWTEGQVNNIVGAYLSNFDDEEIHSFLNTYEKLMYLVNK
ncbi:MarR family transcriptional regulator [Cytobacillus sp. IB215665]|uniref:MarR family winged helix-turn-helix transcriptional regulator n=1 Tax=Cytobacillus sp. IB215665 TaxID=3097357 RepID=UPI002A0C1E31|nr:MarR family transcriptional regulator [Cytobacillus sp. IB215665]MDX8366647.1 MarR family transcriptional regulator [Cytobacillus sp. IB215665]